MSEPLTPEQLEFNTRLDPRVLLQKMGFAEEAIADEGTRIRLYCPIHKDQVRRSLILDKTQNRFQCQYKDCPAHNGGPLVELLALYLGVGVPEAIRQFEEGNAPQRSLTAQADQLIAQSRLTDAARLLEKAVRISPRDEIARCKLAALYLELNQRERGFREYLVAAEDFAVKNQIDKTLSIYNILVMLAPQDIRVRRQMAFLFSRLGRHKEAAEHLKWVVDQLLARGQVEEAVKTSRQILERCPAEPTIHLLLARLLSQVHRINDAVLEAQQAAELALEAGDRPTVEEAVTLGLIYNPMHERLRELQDQLRATPVPVKESSGALGESDEFGQWLESLEQEVSAPSVNASTPVPPPTAGTSSIRQERWMTFCRNNLSSLNEDKLNSMEDHLRSMYDDVQASYKQGFLSEWELNIIKDFYASFCKAYDQVRKVQDDQS